jgi:hypothetical protein
MACEPPGTTSGWLAATLGPIWGGSQATPKVGLVREPPPRGGQRGWLVGHPIAFPKKIFLFFKKKNSKSLFFFFVNKKITTRELVGSQRVQTQV